MKHNLVGHGYGIMRDVRVTPRESTGITGRTPDSASLGDLPHVMNADVEPGTKSYAARPALAEPNPRYDTTRPEKLGWRARPLDRVASEIAWFGTEPTPRKSSTKTVRRTNMSDAARTEKFNADVRTWCDRARNQINPVRFIQTEVPARYRAAVVQLATTAN